MHRFRPFRNTDTPHLAAVWCSQKRQRGLAQPVSAAQLEQIVFSKILFDREGLIVATDEERPCGFVHAGFGPTADEQGLSTEMGVVCLVMVHSSLDSSDKVPALAADLLARSEMYLRRHGAKLVYGGGIRPLNPFYLGLYGGSELPGILDSDIAAQTMYRAAGYREIDRVAVMQCDLTRFRPITTHGQLTIRRQMEVHVVPDPPTRSWWQATTEGSLDRTRFDLVLRDSGDTLAEATCWRVEPLATTWGLSAVGLLDLKVVEQHRQQGLATYLLGETFRRLRSEGVTLVEAQTMEHNTAALALYHRLGFVHVDRGSVFRKGS